MHQVTIESCWGELEPDDINTLAIFAQNIVTSAKAAGLVMGDEAINLAGRALKFAFKFGDDHAAAVSKGASKERRDAFRMLFDRVCSDETLDPAVSMFGSGKITVSPAQIRNRLTLTALQLAASGVVSPRWIESQMVSEGSDVSQVLTNLDTTLSRQSGYSSLTNAVEALFKGIKASTNKAAYLFTINNEGTIIAVDAAEATTTTEATTTSTKEETTMTLPISSESVRHAIENNVFETLDAAVAMLLDNNLVQLGLPKTADIGKAFKELATKAVAVAAAPVVPLTADIPAPATGEIPAGRVTLRSAADVFGLTGAAATPFKFQIPYYEWDDAHPHVPAIDPTYQFQPQQLLSVLVALVTNQRAWLYGDTGCGKTTVIEQAAARMNYPVIRVNFDSEITRMDLIGAKDIVVSGGHAVTTFTEGVLPMAMQMPCIFLADELDFIRADVAYVFQRALEGNGLALPEDGGRIVHPHSGFRIIATANTQGQGDETGRYQGAKPQSSAFLDRFTMWINCDYMTDKQVTELLSRRFPSIPSSVVTSLAGYAREHWVAFKNAQVLTALSPRGLLSCALTYTVFSSVMDPKPALVKAMNATFVDRASKADATTIKGLITRVVA